MAKEVKTSSFLTEALCREGADGWAAVQPGELQWEEAREHRQGGRDISAICNTSHSRWTYHKARCEVAITHNVVCAMFLVLGAGQAAQRPGSWTETAWLGVMKLPGSPVHPPFCIAVSEQSRCQTQWKEPESRLKTRSRFFGEGEVKTLARWRLETGLGSLALLCRERRLNLSGSKHGYNYIITQYWCVLPPSPHLLPPTPTPPPPAQHGAMFLWSSLLSADGQNPTKRVSLTTRWKDYELKHHFSYGSIA